MTGREWKPGDVAIRTYYGRSKLTVATTCIGEYHEEGLHWHHIDGGWDRISDDDGPTYRPLVVIDPEDREQVERLWRIWTNLAPDHRLAQDCMQAALREFAHPKPPRPEEPTGLGAVVVDRDGSELVRVARDGDKPWRASGGYRFSWDEIDFLSEVAPGAEPLADWEIDLLRGAR